jgi:diguanylate cyclase (GGDEF)-like protein
MEFKTLNLRSSLDVIFTALVREFECKNCVWLSQGLVSKLLRISKDNWLNVEELSQLEHALYPYGSEQERLWFWDQALALKATTTVKEPLSGCDYTFLPLLHPDSKSFMGLIAFENLGVDLLRVQELLTQGSRHISFCLEYLEAKSLSYVDDLTSLFNQRYLPQVLEQEIDRSHRKGQKFSLLFLDVDCFKRINDSHGHVVGSQLLVEVSRIIRNTIRSYDPLFRYGGDEFLGLLVDTDKATGEKVAERIRRAIESHEFEIEGKNLKLTVSIGLSVFPEHAKTAKELIQLADQAMYYGKNKSRNIVYIAS